MVDVSWQAVNWALDMEGLEGNPKTILIALARRADPEGANSYPGNAELMRIIDKKVRTVQYILRELTRIGLIEPTNNNTGGRGLKREYRLCMERAQPLEEFGPLKGATSVHDTTQPQVHGLGEEKGATTEQERVQPDDAKGATEDPSNLIEESIEISKEESNPPPTPSVAEPEEDLQQDFFVALIKAYESNAGIITPIVAENMKHFLREFNESHGKDPPVEWAVDAVTEAARNNARTWNYIEAILERWGREGQVDNRSGRNGQTSRYDNALNRPGSRY